MAEAIAAMFGEECATIDDLRKMPHSGYRAVHVKLRTSAGRIEVQVRTHLQGAWANTYEAAGDKFGRSIRYGSLPDGPDQREMVIQLHQFSELVRRLEVLRSILIARPDDPVWAEVRELEADVMKQLADLERELRGAGGVA